MVELWTALARRGMMSCKSGATLTTSRDVPQPQLSFSAKDDSIVRPILLTLYQATNVTIQNINMINGPEWINFVCPCDVYSLESAHLKYPQVNEGKDITYNNITISAESTSDNEAKNTDGWDIYRSDSVVIADSNINNGDEVYIPCGSHNWVEHVRSSSQIVA